MYVYVRLEIIKRRITIWNQIKGEKKKMENERLSHFNCDIYDIKICVKYKNK